MTDSRFRYAILAAVSSDPQAHEDKASLPDQIDMARKAGASQGGVETTEPYILDGYSRTGYVNLSDALRDIPPLARAIDEAIANKWDVLIVDNWDRLGDLAPMLSTVIRKQHKKQIHSARQSGPIADPQKYNPSEDEAGDIMIHVEGLIQGYRLNKLMRAKTIGVKRRVESGQYSIRFPAGYIKDSDGNLQLDAPVANLLIRLKDLFLAGASLRDLATIADNSGIPAPRGGTWYIATLTVILQNPFYAGKVFRDRWKVSHKRTSKSGKRIHVMKLNPNATLLPGKHPALWSMAEHKRILEEMSERYKIHPRRNPHNFSGLLICSICGKRLIHTDNHRYKCYHHISIKDDIANDQIGQALAQAIRNYKDTPPPEPSVDTAEQAIAALEKQILKVQAGYEKEIYSLEQAQEKIRTIRNQIGEIRSRGDDHIQRLANHEKMLSVRDEWLPRLDELVHDLREGDMRANNRRLRNMLSGIEITPEGEARFIFR